MRKRVYIALAVALLLLAGVIEWQVLREPVYQGKRLSIWLELIFLSKSHPDYAGSATEAIRRFGTNALPLLFKKLRTPNTRLEQSMTRWTEQHNLVHVHFKPAINRRWEALWRYQALDPLASVQVPSLSDTLTNNSAVEVRIAAAVALGFIGPEARSAAPALFQATQDTNASVRGFAFEALARIRPDSGLTIPVLIIGLNDHKLFVQQYAAITLREYGPEARVAVPLLLRMLPTDKAAGIVDAAAVSALKAIDPEAAAKAEVK